MVIKYLSDPKMQPLTVNHINMNSPTVNIIQVNGINEDYTVATDDNRKAWDAIADWWDAKQSETGDDGNDMFTQCLLPEVEQLADYQPGQTVLDLGAGSGIICRMFAKKGAEVTGLDYSELMLQKARIRAEKDGHRIVYDYIDLMNIDNMRAYAEKHKP
jgi:2-polyprenyl-3-methyl-5-hydroxy-6-metoxy-1,4-benzoquinol methylase